MFGIQRLSPPVEFGLIRDLAPKEAYIKEQLKNHVAFVKPEILIHEGLLRLLSDFVKNPKLSETTLVSIVWIFGKISRAEQSYNYFVDCNADKIVIDFISNNFSERVIEYVTHNLLAIF